MTRVLKWFDPISATSKCSCDSFQSVASTNSGDQNHLLSGNAVVECNSIASEILSKPVSDQMLLKPASQPSADTQMVTAETWRCDQNIASDECISIRCDILSIPDSDQMLLKQAFRSSVVTKKATAKAWLRDRKIEVRPKRSMESMPAQQLPGAVSQG